jgi:hypothetical protein
MMIENLEVFLVLKDGTSIKVSGEASIIVLPSTKEESAVEKWFKEAAPNGDLYIEKEVKVALKKLDGK